MAGEGRRTTIPHVSALDGARGLAVAGVLLFHGGHLRGGYLGVDFFFTLSGFLITSLLLAESSRDGSIALGGFWSRRARRLLPALAILLVGVAIYCVTLAKASELAQIRGDALATLAYVANWHQIFSHQSYFALFNAPSPLDHTWSLAIEEQFYLLWPLVFVAILVRFKRDTPKAILATSLALAAGSSVLMFALYDPNNTSRAYFGTDTRAAAILLGVALAAALARYGPVAKRSTRVGLEVVGIAGIAVLAVAWTQLDGQSARLYRGGFLVCGLAATAIIAAAVNPTRGPIARALSFKPLCALGLISYGVYLYHWPIDVAVSQTHTGIRGWPLFLIQTAIALVIAFASYRFVEQPIRRGALSSVQMRTLTPVVALALVITILAVTSAHTAVPTNVASARHEIAAATRARQQAAPGAQRILIVGDSVAYLLGNAFQKLESTTPIAVDNAAVVACVFPPTIIRAPAASNGGSVEFRPCHPAWETDVVKAFRPTLVFWITTSQTSVGGLYQGQRMVGCSQPVFKTVYQRDLRNEIARLGALGAKVVVTTAAYDVNTLFSRSSSQNDCENEMRRTVAAASAVQLVDLFSYICPDGFCRSKIRGVTLRPDGLHYEGPGAELVAQWLLDQAHAPR
jgi:peptidoglycan/LPS O-acetylase OafA/YrhL